jgi:hypothetical protein
MTFGNDGAYWFGQFNGNDLGRLTPEGQYTTLGGFPAVPNRGPRQITTGPDNTLWVTLDVPGDPTDDAVGRVTGVEPPAPPAGGSCNQFQLGNAKKNKKKGTAKLSVTVPCAGEVELAKTKKVKADEQTAGAAGEVKLLVKPKGKAKEKLQEQG